MVLHSELLPHLPASLAVVRLLGRLAVRLRLPLLPLANKSVGVVRLGARWVRLLPIAVTSLGKKLTIGCN